MRTETQTSSIIDFLGCDHRRMSELWEDCIDAINRCDIAQVAFRFEQFAARLRRHIGLEEEIFFPAFEERTGMRGAGPTSVMRAEHREIEAILDRMSAATRNPDCTAIRKALAAEPIYPAAFFQSHDRKEEGVIYPMADQVLSEEERRQLIEKMRAR
jgi:hemerythrin-like domain-containing protein